MIPRIHGVARLGGDIKLLFSKDGKAIVKVSLAFSEQEETLWLNAVAFGKTAENINQYFSKGDRIEVEGRIKVNEYVTSDGNKRRDYQLIIERFGFIESKKQKPKREEKATPKPKPKPKPELDIEDEEIPF